MTLYASKTPRDLNRDPEPYVYAFGGERLSREDAYWNVGRVIGYEPRPEFDHPQHNEPNPILLDLRDTHGLPDLWLEAIEGRDGDVFLAGVPRAFGDVRADHINHARRVLRRLASFGGAS